MKFSLTFLTGIPEFSASITSSSICSLDSPTTNTNVAASNSSLTASLPKIDFAFAIKYGFRSSTQQMYILRSLLIVYPSFLYVYLIPSMDGSDMSPDPFRNQELKSWIPLHSFLFLLAFASRKNTSLLWKIYCILRIQLL